MTVEQVLQLVSFSLGVAAFVAGLCPLPKTQARVQVWITVLFAGLLAFVATTTALAWETHQRSAHIERVCDKIVRSLEGGAKSVDQLHEDLAYEDLGTVSEAVGRLVENQKVGHHVVEVRDGADLRYRARLFYVVNADAGTAEGCEASP